MSNKHLSRQHGWNGISKKRPKSPDWKKRNKTLARKRRAGKKSPSDLLHAA